MIKVVLVDDCRSARAALRFALERSPDFLVVAEAANGREAKEAIARLQPDLVTMDVFLGSENGLVVTEEILRESAARIVIVTAAPTTGKMAYDALRCGALDISSKLPGPRHPDYEAEANRFRRLLRNLAQVQVLSTRRLQLAGAAAASPLRRAGVEDGNPLSSAALESAREGVTPRRVQIPLRAVLLGASTGGPPVVETLLRRLPNPLPVPVVVIQHIARGFASSYTSWLGEASRQPVELVGTRTPLVGGRVYVAPDDRDLVFTSELCVDAVAAESGALIVPSIDRCFLSAGRHHGPDVSAVVLTGMGSDGAKGLAVLREAGAQCLVQSFASCVVDSMPQAAAASSGASVASPERLAELLRARMVC